MKKAQKQPPTAEEQIITLLQDTKREGMEMLIEYLQKSDFFIAPASTQYHGAFKGGLALHCLNVLDCLITLYNTMKAGAYNVPDIEQESLVIVALLHDVCKINCYHEDFRNVKNAAGEWERVPCYKREPLLAMGHGGKSMFILQNFIALSVEEAQAIFWHMGAYDTSPYMTNNELGQAYDENFLAYLLHTADMMSTYVLENKHYQ